MRLFIAGLILILFAPVLQNSVSAQTTANAGLTELSKNFKDPSKEYRGAPLWTWNSKVTKQDIDAMLRDMKAKGFGGVFVHPRPGLITEYLSDEWFDLFTYSVEVGKKIGMDVWIYDENSYPSGFAGGHVPAQMPESYDQGQGLAIEKFSELPSDAGDYYLCLKREGDNFTDITASLENYKGKPGDYYLFKMIYYPVSDWTAGFPYVDLLVDGVTEKFLEVTMEGYEKALDADLGPVVKGIFTDEPNIATPGGVRWTPDLFDIFQKRWGYDLKTKWPMLIEEIGNWKEVRHNYMETVLQLFIDRWAKPWYEYCEEKGLLWTGHYWEHGWPDVGHGPDNMAMYAWHQMPAIDMLFNTYDESSPTAQFGNVRAVKELASVANQLGYDRRLSETYGAAGWSATFEDFKRLGDWEYVLGVNFMNQHYSPLTITGARKYDHPPYFSYHATWWNQYKPQNDYFGRLSYAMSRGEQYNDILILENTTTVWTYYTYYQGASPKLMEIARPFQNMVTRLEHEQVEFDLGSENIIKDRGSVKDGKFVIGQRAYGTVVIPPMTENLNKPTFELLKRFVAQGGKLLTFSIPTMLDGKISSEITDFFRFERAIVYIPEMNDTVADRYLRNDRISFPNLTGKSLYHQRRTYDDGELVFLVNSSLTETVTADIEIVGQQLLELDLSDGGTYSYPFTQTGGKVEANFELPPAGSLMLFASSSNAGGYKEKPRPEYIRTVESSSPLEIKRIRDNVMTIDYLDIEINGEKYAGEYFASATQKYFQAAGFPNGDPWCTSVQFKRNTVDRDDMTTGSATAAYHFTVGPGIDFKTMKVVIEQPELWTSVKVNGRTVEHNKGEWYLDKGFGVFSIGGAVKEGDNTIEVNIAPFSVFAEFEPVYVTGDFTVVPADKGWKLEKPVASFTLGSWKSQGQPFYPWEVSYSKKYRITDTSADYAVKLPDWGGTVAEVFVNGKSAGIIAYKPYILDIEKLLKKGENTIEVRVIGSHHNLMGPHHHPLGGIAGPGHWKVAGGPVPGNKYTTLNYGLNKDFELVSTK